MKNKTGCRSYICASSNLISRRPPRVVIIYSEISNYNIIYSGPATEANWLLNTQLPCRIGHLGSTLQMLLLHISWSFRKLVWTSVLITPSSQFECFSESFPHLEPFISKKTDLKAVGKNSFQVQRRTQWCYLNGDRFATAALGNELSACVCVCNLLYNNCSMFCTKLA